MEEKAKVEAQPIEATRPEKMSYEQLENVAHQLSEQSRQLYAKLQEANMANMFKRLDYLFKVVENAHAFSEEFVAKCVAEIEDLMTVPESEETEDKPEE
jgi:hypothetical protein